MEKLLCLEKTFYINIRKAEQLDGEKHKHLNETIYTF